MNLLERYKTNKDVSIKSKDGLHMIKYKDLGVDWRNEDTRLARGLILNDNSEVVARPFDKFFNMNELVGREEYTIEDQMLSMVDEGPVEVTEKRDGSLVIMFNHKGKLKLASSGMLDGEYVEIFEKAVDRLWSKETYHAIEELSKQYTLLFEYTAPDNEIVIYYEEDKLTLIGMRETKTGKDFTMKEIKNITAGTGIDYADILELKDMNEVEEYIKNAENVEGVVVLFTDTMKRVKIKTQDYFEKHSEGKKFYFSREGLSRAQRASMEELIFNGEEGYIEDNVAKYRGIEVFKAALSELDELKASVAKFTEDLETIKWNAKFFDAIQGTSYVEIINSEEKINGVPIQLGFLLLKELEGFWKAQEDYEAIKKVVKNSVHKKLMAKINEEVGAVSNYSSKISHKSYIEKVLDKRKFWKAIKPLNLY